MFFFFVAGFVVCGIFPEISVFCFIGPQIVQSLAVREAVYLGRWRDTNLLLRLAGDSILSHTNDSYIPRTETMPNKTRLPSNPFQTVLLTGSEGLARLNRPSGKLVRSGKQQQPSLVTSFPSGCLIATIDHFTVLCSVTRPLSKSEAGVDLALIQTSLLFFH